MKVILNRIDYPILVLMHDIRFLLATQVMFFFTFLGSTGFLTAGTIFAFVYLAYRKESRRAFLFVFGILSSVWLNNIIKDLIKRPRPNFFPLVHETSYSFPSGHAMNSVVFYSLISYCIFWQMKNKKLGRLLTALVIVSVVVIGVSRVYLGVHFPTDVFGGWVIGFGWFLCIVYLDKKLRMKHS